MKIKKNNEFLSFNKTKPSNNKQNENQPGTLLHLNVTLKHYILYQCEQQKTPLRVLSKISHLSNATCTLEIGII